MESISFYAGRLCTGLELIAQSTRAKTITRSMKLFLAAREMRFLADFLAMTGNVISCHGTRKELAGFLILSE